MLYCLIVSRNNPLAAQQPAPAFANDPSGFWGAVLSENAVAGIGSILPANTLTQADNAVKGRLLNAQISWTPAKARWKNSNLDVSLSDSQFLQMLEAGGDMPQGQVTVLVSKLQFSTGWPDINDTLQIQARGKWHDFIIAGVSGNNDDNEPGLTLLLDKDQNEEGD